MYEIIKYSKSQNSVNHKIQEINTFNKITKYMKSLNAVNH